MTSDTSTPSPLPSTLPLASPILEDAWIRFGKYDKNALRAQRRFIWERKLILGLSVAATALAVLYTVLESSKWQLPYSTGPSSSIDLMQYLLPVLRFCVVTVPIISGALAAFTVKFNMGVNWVMLRSSAEALKKEIYRYRMRVDEYGLNPLQAESRDVQLARKLKIISRRLMETQVNQTGLQPYDNKQPPAYITNTGDDGFSDLTPEQYVLWRVDDQFSYYQRKSIKFSKEAQRFQLLILVLGIVGALLAAFKLEIWVAVSGAFVTAFTSFLEFKRVESTVIACNRAAADLYDIRTWWRSLSDTEKTQRVNIETLVDSTEAVIQSENAGWVQEMRDALAEIYGKKKEEEAIKSQASDSAEAEAIAPQQPPAQPPPQPLPQPEPQPPEPQDTEPSLQQPV
jgi:hypothetical protein